MIATRREKLREATYKEIKEVAQKQMKENGSVALSLRAIAAEMGITAPALYRYYASRDELITALIVDAYNSLAEALEEASQKTGDESYGNQLIALSTAFREWAVANPEKHALVYGSPIPDYHAPIDKTTPAAQRANMQFIGIFEAAWRAGQILIPVEFAEVNLQEFASSEAWLQSYDLTMPLTLYFAAMGGWAQMQGLLALELNGQLHYMQHDNAAFYRLHIVLFTQRLGLTSTL